MPKVLIIDDEKPIRQMLRTLFEKECFTVFDAPNGDKGFNLFKEKQPDIIILDMLMPEKDGVEALNLIRGISKEVKIIAISGGGVVNPDVYLNLAKKLGCDETFMKPVEKDKLLKAVKSLLFS
ncbi:MAG: response regulator [Desulfobacterales bacterium]|nr:response regulator [Desulfobacterales bacterium]MCP4163427.1 response regulator [Deltaproteobacteria bacterium]